MTAPHLSSLLCSSCGYSLAGLPRSGHCPECAQPIARSIHDRASHPQPPVLRRVRFGSGLAACALLLPIFGITTGVVMQSWLVVPLAFLLSAALWIAGGIAISALLPQSGWTEGPDPRGALKASLVLFGLGVAGYCLLIAIEFWGNGLSGGALFLCNSFLFIGAGLSSWFYIFHHLRLLSSRVLRNPTLASACLGASLSAIAVFFAPVFAYAGVGLFAIPFALAPIVTGAIALIGVSACTSRHLRTSRSE